MRIYIEAFRTCTIRRVCSWDWESLRTCRTIHGKEWQQISIENKNTFSTFEISIIGRVKNTTDLDPPRLSAADPICFLPKMLTHE
jgi:hypothetical protein